MELSCAKLRLSWFYLMLLSCKFQVDIFFWQLIYLTVWLPCLQFKTIKCNARRPNKFVLKSYSNSAPVCSHILFFSALRSCVWVKPWPVKLKAFTFSLNINLWGKIISIIIHKLNKYIIIYIAHVSLHSFITKQI